MHEVVTTAIAANRISNNDLGLNLGAGVMAFTRCSALEAAEHGIRINAVSPSIAMHDFLAKASPQEALDHLASLEAFGRAAREPMQPASV